MAAVRRKKKRMDRTRKEENQVEILDARAFCQLICLQPQVQIDDKFAQQSELSRRGPQSPTPKYSFYDFLSSVFCLLSNEDGETVITNEAEYKM